MTLENIEVIAPNLKRRLSGVTATIARLLPVQAQSIGIVATGSGLPAQLPCVSALVRAPDVPAASVVSGTRGATRRCCSGSSCVTF